MQKHIFPSLGWRGRRVGILLLVTFLFASCKKEFVVPRASGRPYEVMVVMSDRDWEAKQGRALFTVLDTDIPGLPQPERSFHISHVEPQHFDHVLNIFRNIILVDINKQIYTKTSMKFTRDKYAIDQIVLTIQSPTPEEFADFCFDHGQDIIDFLTKMEMNRLVKELKDKYSKKTAELAKEIFDYTGTILGEALADFTAFSSPEAFVLFGGLTKSGDLIMNPIKKAYDESVLRIFRDKAKFLVSELDGAGAAVLGASALGWEVK